MDSAAGDLHAELVESGIADNSVMLKCEVEVARLAQARARPGILAEHLVLRRGRKAGNERGRNAHAEEGVVAIVPVMVEAGRP